VQQGSSLRICSDIPCIVSKALLAVRTSTQHKGLTAILTVVNQWTSANYDGAHQSNFEETHTVSCDCSHRLQLSHTCSWCDMDATVRGEGMRNNGKENIGGNAMFLNKTTAFLALY